MSPDTPLFGRLTLGGNRINLGRGGFNVLMIRAAEQLKKLRVGDDTVIQIECSRNRMQDASTFDKLQVIEHQLAAKTITDPSTESPFPGVTVGRVNEAMASQEYAAYAEICDPIKRLGLTKFFIDGTRLAYEQCFPDCAPYFPKWIE